MRTIKWLVSIILVLVAWGILSAYFGLPTDTGTEVWDM